MENTSRIKEFVLEKNLYDNILSKGNGNVRSVKGNNSALLSDTQERRSLPWAFDGQCDPWGV